MFSAIYTRIVEILDVGEDRFSGRQALFLCFVAYAFGVVMRSFYLWNALDIPSVLLDGVPMISTEDGYFFADLANYFLKDDYSRVGINPWHPGAHAMIAVLTSTLTKILPFTLEQVAVFVPMIFAPLIAVPMLYAGRWMGSTAMGFGAALIANIALPYLKRTSFAYFDTDIFALTAPAMIVALAIYAINNPGLIQIALVVMMSKFTGWLDKPLIGEAMLVPFSIVYLIANFRNPKIYQHIILMCTGFMHLAAWQWMIINTAILTGGLYAVDKYLPQLNKRIWQGLALLVMAYTFWQSQLYNTISSYMGSYGQAGRGVQAGFGARGWSFYQVTGTIVEARQIDLFSLSREVSGYIYLFWLGLLGSILALVRFPVLAAGGVFFSIGLFSLEGGIRFSMYIVPILAFGSAYLALLISRYIHQLPYVNRVRYLNYAIALVFIAITLYPGYRLASNYSPRTVAQLSQVQMLKNLNQKTDSTDYIISWWDYGYVMSFYSDMRNIINGAKHQNDNYIVSRALSSSSQRLAANLVRESVEIYEENGRGQTAINALLGSRREGFNPNDFVNSMSSPGYVLQRPKTREIYWYLPYQMIPIYGVVRYFSDLDLNTGKIRRAPLIATRNYRVDQENQRILLPNGVVGDIKKGVLIEKGNVIGQINSIYVHSIDNTGQSHIQTTNVNSLGTYYMILSGYYGIVYVLGAEAFRSNFIQMFFFNNYDRELFELVDRNPLATIYRMKI